MAAEEGHRTRAASLERNLGPLGPLEMFRELGKYRRPPRDRRLTVTAQLHFRFNRRSRDAYAMGRLAPEASAVV